MTKQLNKNSFTMLELLVVVLIIAILAALAIPRFMLGTEAAKCAEAKNLIGAIRETEIIWDTTEGGYTSNLEDLGIDAVGSTFSNASVLQTKYWNFTADGTNGTAIATRHSNAGGGYAGTSITIAINGTIGGTHPIGNKLGD